MLNINTNSDVVPIPSQVDIISVKMLSILGYNTEPFTFKVRRRLFGCCNDVKNNSISESLTELESEGVQRSSQEWNFDFSTESPLPAGRYAWEKVYNGDVPVCYQDNEEPRWCVARIPDTVHQNQEDCSKCQKISKNNNKKRSTVKSKKSRLVQTSIRGYARVQKRRTDKTLGLKDSCVPHSKETSKLTNGFITNAQIASTSS